MGNVTIEIPMVSECAIKHCGYNVNNSCHAKAITIGDGINPGCDTFFDSGKHSRETKRRAGVGACKVTACKCNEDFECTAESITVGLNKEEINCLTFCMKQ
jgi:hypothetical protein